MTTFDAFAKQLQANTQVLSVVNRAAVEAVSDVMQHLAEELTAKAFGPALKLSQQLNASRAALDSTQLLDHARKAAQEAEAETVALLAELETTSRDVRDIITQARKRGTASAYVIALALSGDCEALETLRTQAAKGDALAVKALAVIARLRHLQQRARKVIRTVARILSTQLLDELTAAQERPRRLLAGTLEPNSPPLHALMCA
jgi:hypothetical protein